MIGLLSSAFLISQAFQGWADEPTITTLDTIAAPIKDVQFPTVTVCNDPILNPPDNWGFVENVLNQFQFRCDDSLTCNKTEPLRKDYEFVIEFALKNFLKWVLKPENLDHSERILKPVVMTEEKFDYMIVHFEKLVTNGSLSIKEVEDLSVKYFMKQINMVEVDMKIDSKDQNIQEEHCNSTTCKKIKNLVHLLFHVTIGNGKNFKFHFGSFLRNFMNNFKSFDLLRKHLDSSCALMSFPCKINSCFSLRKGEKQLHGLFALMSTLIGFKNDISLYELPGILSYDQQPILTPQLFYYERCKRSLKVNLMKIHYCHRIWLDFILATSNAKSEFYEYLFPQKPGV